MRDIAAGRSRRGGGRCVAAAAAGHCPIPHCQIHPCLAGPGQLCLRLCRARQRIMKARGIDFDIARGFGSMASAQAVAGGQFEFGIVAAPPLILSVAKGLPLIALATCDYDATMGVGVLDSSPFVKPQDLTGKNIASLPTSDEFPFFPPSPATLALPTTPSESVPL